jgi:alanine-glyoxylate transaminase/serine-glyoxylate transaminase/serine-pyruvate transaminase
MRHFLPDRADVHRDLTATEPLGELGPGDPAVVAAWPGLQAGLGALFGTRGRVLIDPLPPSAWFDAVLRTGVRRRVLVLVTGPVGERFARAAEACGKEAVRLHVPPGRALEPDVARQFLDGPPFDAVLVPHVEPGSGLLEPLAELARVWRSDSCVIIADVTYSMGAVTLDIDRAGVDFAVGASHLALGLPPGLSFVTASDRLLERVRETGARGWALDLLRHSAASERGRPLHLPAPELLGALRWQLGRIDASGGPAARAARHGAMRRHVDAWAEACGLELAAPPAQRAPMLSVLRTGERSAAGIIERLHEQGVAIATPLDDRTDRAIAFGHMADLDVGDLDVLLPRLLEAMS